MPTIVVTDLESGEQVAIPQEAYDPARHEYAQERVLGTIGGEAAAYTPEELARVTGAPASVVQPATPEELLAQTRTQAEESRYGALEKAGAVVRGGLAGATGGLSEIVFAPDTALAREEAEARTRQVSKYQFAGEIIGALASAGLSGSAGVAGKVARITPSGQIAARATALTRAAQARGLGTIPAHMLGGALDNAAISATNYLATQSIRDEPIGIDGLLAYVGPGALIGGSVAGLGGLLSRGGEAAATAIRRAEQEGGGALASLVGRGQTEVLTEAAEALTKRPSKTMQLGEMFSKATKGAGANRNRVTRILDMLDDRAARAGSAERELNDLLSAATATGQTVDTAAVDAAQAAIANHRDMVAAAQNWAPGLRRELEEIPKGQVRKSLEGIGTFATPLANLDAADEALEAAMGALRPAAAAPGVAEAAKGIGSRAMDLVGLVETAQTMGLPVPDVDRIPGVGPLLATYGKFRTLQRAGQKMGIVPMTRAAQAARSVAQTADQISSVTDSVARGVTRIAMSAGVRRAGAIGSKAAAKRLIRDVLDADAATVAQTAKAELDEFPPDIADAVAQRAAAKVDYLKSVAPQPPPGTLDLEGFWTPSQDQRHQFAEVYTALELPGNAVKNLFGGHWLYPQAVADGIRAVYPEIWTSVQTSLVQDAPRILKNNDRSKVTMWGQLFDVPIAPELAPSYRFAAPEATMPAEPTMPPPSTVSNIAEAAETQLSKLG